MPCRLAAKIISGRDSIPQAIRGQRNIATANANSINRRGSKRASVWLINTRMMTSQITPSAHNQPATNCEWPPSIAYKVKNTFNGAVEILIKNAATKKPTTAGAKTATANPALEGSSAWVTCRPGTEKLTTANTMANPSIQ